MGTEKKGLTLSSFCRDHYDVLLKRARVMLGGDDGYFTPEDLVHDALVAILNRDIGADPLTADGVVSMMMKMCKLHRERQLPSSDDSVDEEEVICFDCRALGEENLIHHDALLSGLGQLNRQERVIADMLIRGSDVYDVMKELSLNETRVRHLTHLTGITLRNAVNGDTDSR